MEEVIRQLQQQSDIVIFDTPPCVPMTDAQVLGTKLDGILLVAQIDDSRKAELRHARERLEQAHIRILGVVANRLGPQHGRYYYRYSHYRGDGPANGAELVSRTTALLPRLTEDSDGALIPGAEETDGRGSQGEGGA
jgi:Mrp family chromosome partitioning ATPase